MPKQSVTPLGRLRHRIGYTQAQAADLNDIPYRTLVHLEQGGGRQGVHLRLKIDYAKWLVEQAQRLGLPSIPDMAELLPDVYGEPESKNPRREPGDTHGNVRVTTLGVKPNAATIGIISQPRG